MASDLSSGCTDDIEIFDEKEEGEISLEDVSSSEESHPNYRSGFRATGRCPVCSGSPMCHPWCSNARAMQKIHRKRDAAHGKENRRLIKDSSGTISKHPVSTLQEKNDDLVPISSDSDMEIVGLPGNSKQLNTTRLTPKSAKVRKKKKKKRSHSSIVRVEELSSPTEVETYLIDVPLVKTVRASKSRHGDSSSPRYNVRSPPIERPVTRSPSRRYRARPLRSRSPLRRSRSPISRVNTAERRSPRKLRSPRRSPARSGTKSSLAADDDAPSSQTCIDLLKKVRRLESVGVGGWAKNKLSRSKEHSSLKEKLSNMLKNNAEPSSEKPVTRGSRDNATVTNDNNNTDAAESAAVESVDDEDDIELLRRLALETKQKKAENKIDQAAKVENEANVNNTEANLNDDNDNEAYELRLIALRSAIMKNHENRVKRGVKPKRRKKSKTRLESPFGKSFLDDLPIPDDDDSRISSPGIKIPIVDNDEDAASNHPEDMDLDTDVEREKEKDSMPYSPTDDITRQITVDEELPSHVFNDNNSQFTFPHCQKPRHSQNSIEETSYYLPGYDTPYSPSAPTKTPTTDKISRKISDARIEKETPCSPCDSDYEPGIDTPYSPPSPTKTPIMGKSKSTYNEKTPYASDGSDYEPGIDTPYSPSKPIETPKTNKFSSRNCANITETPYSPTDTPICDLDVLSPGPAETTSLSADVESRTNNDVGEKLAILPPVARQLASSMMKLSREEEDEDVEPTREQSEILDPQLEDNEAREAAMLFSSVALLDAQEESNKTIETIRAIEQLPEIDLDGSPLVPLSKEHEAAEVVIPLEISPQRAEPCVEPLYLQGLPDVTKDTNKIPTLVNRTLVPAPILKTNKNLQQPLPQKKLDNQSAEPSFKSAEMRPVSVENAPAKSSALFKPIKLCAVSKKPQVMLASAAAFNSSFVEDSARETKSDQEPEVVEISSQQIVEPPTKIKPKSPLPADSHDSDGYAKKQKRRKRLQERNKRNKRKSATSGRAESPSPVHERSTSKLESTSSNSSSSRQIKSTISSSRNRSPVSRVSGSGKNTPTRRSKSGQIKCSPSKSNRLIATEKQAGTSSNVSPKKTAKKNRREKRLLRKVEATQAESTESRRESNANKSTKELSPGEGTSSGVTRVKSSSPKISKCIEQSSSRETSGKNKNEGDLSGKREQPERTVENKGAEQKRRCSLDDDEEALRALLLASLPKRQKPVEAPSTPANPIFKLPQLSDPTTTDTSAENSANKALKEAATACLSDAVFTPPNPLILSSPSSSASNATPFESLTTNAQPKKIEVARKILASESSNDAASSSPRKRVNPVAPKGPPKKIVKKALPVIASTKVVNNAKKYQNAMLQKKLNLQRAASIYSAQNGSRNITLNNLKINEAARPSSPKMSTSSKMQRLIINLGSDTDSESDDESQPSSSPSADAAAEMRKPLAIPTTDFEKSVVQFLKDQRKKLESVAVAKTTASSPTTAAKPSAPSTSTVKLTGSYSTPLAVRRHLPMSQQEEYRRLKQQIMERERQKLQKTIENGAIAQNRNCRSPCTPPGPLSPASPIAAALRLDSQKVSSVASQVAAIAPTVPAAVPNKDNNTVESNLAAQQKIHLSKANENPSIVIVTKVPTKLTQGIPPKQLTNPAKPPVTSSKVNSSNSIVTNTPAKTSTPKLPTKILPKVVNSVVPNVPKIPVNNTSTPKVPAKSAQKSLIIAKSHMSTKATSLPLAKSSVVSTTEIRRNSVAAELSSVATHAAAAESSTGISSDGKERWISGSTSAASGTRISFGPSTARNSLKATEMLTIQIPNDKVRIDRIASTDNSRSASNSPTINGQSVGMLRVLTKEQLNNRFVQIQVEKGPAGRRVTVGGSPASSDDFAQFFGSPSLKVSPERSDKTDRTVCCDSRLIISDINDTRRAEIECSNYAARSASDDTTVVNSEASTLVLSRHEENSRNDTNFDSTASTFVAVYANSPSRDNLENTRTQVYENNATTLPPKTTGAKQNKLQAKEIWDKIKTDVKNELEVLTTLPIEQQQKLLEESQEKLVTKRNVVLEDLTTMSGCLHQWEVEREIQTKLVAEVRRLREQLRTAEDRLHEQRRQMNGMGPKVTKAHEKINHGRRECYKLSRICQGLGTKIIGEDYKVPNTGAQLLNERLKEVAIHTRQLSKKKVPPISPNNSRDESLTSAGVENETIVLTESDNSLVERPPSTAISETELDDGRETRENSISPEQSNPVEPIESAEAPRSPISDESRVTEKENDDLKSSSVVVVSPTKETESSNSNNTVCLTRENDEATSSLRPEEVTNLEESETSRTGTISLTIPNASAAQETIEFISVPGTSNSDSCAGPSSSIEQRQQFLAAKKTVDPYKSVLAHLKTPRSDNPDGILCPYELMGTCNDGDCQFYHLDPGHCQ